MHRPRQSFRPRECVRPSPIHDEDGRIIVVANRAPYERAWDGRGERDKRRPASGLVTAIEPLLQTYGGTWIAHGDGPSDPETASQPYSVRRLPIAQDDYERYYSGFANEALWPLCHIAYVRPYFRAEEWAAYRKVNKAFARAAVEESAGNGVILIQDYHLALVPRMIRSATPRTMSNLFWHIPWPNAEIFDICPWRAQIIDGMLGADVVGFHIRQSCLNFLESAQRSVDCCVDREEMSILFHGHTTLVREYPISVPWPYPAASRADGLRLRRRLGIGDGVHVALGVDRADYTKGLIDRIAAIEMLLERNPSLAGRYVYVQLASPTRTDIAAYRQLAHELELAAAAVNERFGTPAWKPVLLQMRTHSPEEVRTYYAMADSAVVTPLHDGMNLVAKEYVASRTDGDGVLVLSRFAGAAKELQAALLVNPWDMEETARALQRAVRMPAAERQARMQSMQRHIAAHSIHEWSESLLHDLQTAARQDAASRPRPLISIESGERQIQEAIS